MKPTLGSAPAERNGLTHAARVRVALVICALGGAAFWFSTREPPRHEETQAELTARLTQQKAVEREAALAQRSRDADATASAARARSDSFKAMTPAQRAERMKAECSAGPCEPGTVVAIASAGADEKERLALTKQAEKAQKEREKAEAAADERAALAARTEFASKVDRELLARGMNPQRVGATGPTKTTLHIDLSLCSRQFLHDVSQGDIGLRAGVLGFKRIECSDTVSESGSVDL